MKTIVKSRLGQFGTGTMRGLCLCAVICAGRGIFLCSWWAGQESFGLHPVGQLLGYLRQHSLQGQLVITVHTYVKNYHLRLLNTPLKVDVISLVLSWPVLWIRNDLFRILIQLELLRSSKLDPGKSSESEMFEYFKKMPYNESKRRINRLLSLWMNNLCIFRTIKPIKPVSVFSFLPGFGSGTENSGSGSRKKFRIWIRSAGPQH